MSEGGDASSFSLSFAAAEEGGGEGKKQGGYLGVPEKSRSEASTYLPDVPTYCVT